MAVPVIAAALAIAISGCSSNSSVSQPTGTPATSASAPATSAGGGGVAAGSTKACTYTRTGTASVSLPPSKTDPSIAYTATMHTSQGAIVFTLLSSKAPCTVNSFVHLADTGFWNGTQCHRISDSQGLYMLQCGDPTAKANETISCSSATVGSGGPGYSFDDENLANATYNAGTVAMANAGPNTNGSQFFLVFQASPLQPDYTPFGTISAAGLAILRGVAKAGTTCTYSAGGGVPRDKVIIDNVTITKG